MYVHNVLQLIADKHLAGGKDRFNKKRTKRNVLNNLKLAVWL